MRLVDLSDDDLAKAADLAVAGATRNSGQRSTAAKHIRIQERVADRFVPMVLKRAKAIRFGDPRNPATQFASLRMRRRPPFFENRTLMAAEQAADILYSFRRQGEVPLNIIAKAKATSGIPTNTSPRFFHSASPEPMLAFCALPRRFLQSSA